MQHYKLHYFNLRGRAELARLVLHQAGVEFEDYRFERAEWPQLKSSYLLIFFFLWLMFSFHEWLTCSFVSLSISFSDYPFGQVPVLEVDGKMLAQSHSIARYLARQHGLAGRDDWEQAQADVYADCINDLMTGITNIIKTSDKPWFKLLFYK